MQFSFIKPLALQVAVAVFSCPKYQRLILGLILVRGRRSGLLDSAGLQPLDHSKRINKCRFFNGEGVDETKLGQGQISVPKSFRGLKFQAQNSSYEKADEIGCGLLDWGRRGRESGS